MRALFDFLLIHLTCFAALIICMGKKRDGFNNGVTKNVSFLKKKEPLGNFVNKLKPHGAFSLILIIVSLVSFFTYLLSNRFVIPVNGKDFDLSNVYLGYLITLLTCIIPFVSEVHNPAIYNAKTITINYIGIITTIVGLLGLLTIVIAIVAENSVATEDYIEIMGRIITYITALIGILGETRVVGTSKLTDFGRATVTILFIFFIVSFINARIEDKNRLESTGRVIREIDTTARIVNQKLYWVNSFIDSNIRVSINSVSTSVNKLNSDIQAKGFATSEELQGIRKNEIFYIITRVRKDSLFMDSLNGVIRSYLVRGKAFEKMNLGIDSLKDSLAATNKNLVRHELNWGSLLTGVETLRRQMHEYSTTENEFNANISRSMQGIRDSCDSISKKLMMSDARLDGLDKENIKILDKVKGISQSIDGRVIPDINKLISKDTSVRNN